ncbi:MAG: T9SS type A sorting domain-containing protein [Bacteroidota bacterium]
MRHALLLLAVLLPFVAAAQLSPDAFAPDFLNGLRNADDTQNARAIDMAIDANGDLYVAGQFTNAGASGRSVGIAVWTADGEWKALGGGFENIIDPEVPFSGGIPQVNEVEVTSQYVYVGGYRMTEAVNPDGSRVRVNNIARWNKATQVWEPLEGNVPGGRDSSSPTGATVSQPGGFAVGVDSLAFVDGLAVIEEADRDRVFIGGNFLTLTDTTEADDAADRPQFNAIVEWREATMGTATWERLGERYGRRTAIFRGNGVDANVASIVAIGTNVYVGGQLTFGFEDYTDSNSTTARVRINGVGVWDAVNDEWSGLGGGLGQGSNGLADGFMADIAEGPGGLIVGGGFGRFCNALDANGDATECTGANVEALGVWDGASWSTLGGLEVRNPVGDVEVVGDQVYVATLLGRTPRINGADQPSLQNVLLFDGSTSQWTDLSGGVDLNGTVASLEVLPGEGVYVNTFESACNTFSGSSSRDCGGDGDRVETNGGPAFWAEGDGWSPLATTIPADENAGLGRPSVRAALWDGDVLYVGGTFRRVYSRGRLVRSQGVARYLPAENRFEALGQGVNGPVEALALEAGKLYVGGRFTGTQATDGTATFGRRSLARWDVASGEWESVGEGVQGGVHALASASGILYVGGAFLNVVNGSPALGRQDCLVRWDVAAGDWLPWDSLLPNDGLNCSSTSTTTRVSALTSAGDGTVYAGGRFSYSKDENATVTEAGLVRWDPAAGEFQPFRSETESFGVSLRGPFGNFSELTGIYSLHETGGTLYAGGLVTGAIQPDGSIAPFGAPFDVLATLVEIDPGATTITPLVTGRGIGYALAGRGDGVFFGNGFNDQVGRRGNDATTSDGSTFSQSAAFLVYDRATQTWANPGQIIGEIRALAIDDTAPLFAGGDFARFRTDQTGPDTGGAILGDNAILFDASAFPVASEPGQPVARETGLALPSPNPARNALRLRFEVEVSGPVSLAIYDLLGRHVSTVHEGVTSAGTHEVLVSVRDFPAGLYLARLVAGETASVRRFTVIR